jgi:hypothetical protein
VKQSIAALASCPNLHELCPRGDRKGNIGISRSINFCRPRRIESNSTFSHLARVPRQYE